MATSLGNSNRSGTGGQRDGGPSAADRFGFGLAVVVNAIMLFVVNNLLAWDLLPFLTEEFDEVLPLVNLSLGVSIGVNVVRMVYAPKWFAVLGDIVATGFGVPALIRTWRVFPFDFDRDGFRWDLGFRAVLFVAIAGSVVGMVVGLVRLARIGASGG